MKSLQEREFEAKVSLADHSGKTTLIRSPLERVMPTKSSLLFYFSIRKA